ncbi:hypothetical protein [Actinoplanes aureus]|uniref:Uncharacterized protein n=1 Tax=Actinoplanes aureus TaxID=2792083 RepID=A0A931C006_9ACTN|nr:hypothetical protein [Actinoplanes aureus]MBG0560750.1 hypothetical protein [Actinoplanes aureus]
MQHTRSPWAYVVLSGAAALLGAATMLLFGVDIQPISRPRMVGASFVVLVAMAAVVLVLRRNPGQCERCTSVELTKAVEALQQQIAAVNERLDHIDEHTEVLAARTSRLAAGLEVQKPLNRNDLGDTTAEVVAFPAGPRRLS